MHQVIYPDNRQADASQISNYIFSICRQHRMEDRALAFAFIISDLDNPQLTKILRDADYVNALHNISGKLLTVFFLNDNYVDKTINKYKDSNIMRLELSVEPIDAPPNISPKALANVLINDEILSSPAILFFQIDDNARVIDYFITNLNENKIEEGFLEIKNIIATAVSSFDRVKDENKKNSQALFNLLRHEINASEFWKKAKKNYGRIMNIKDFLFFWK